MDQKLLRIFVSAMFVFAPTVSGMAQISAGNFVIDESKPYVYIKFDHLGERKPVEDWESTKGLWLRIVNNCRLPIQISVLGPGTGDPGVVVDFEVVRKGGPDAPDASQGKKMPPGYGSGVGTIVEIPPKGDLLFSVPSETVSDQWFIQVRFSFALPESKSFSDETSGNYDPYSVVDFTWYNIPEKYRKPESGKDKPPGDGRIGMIRPAT